MRSFTPIRPHVRAYDAALGTHCPAFQIQQHGLVRPSVRVDDGAVMAVEPFRAVDQQMPDAMRADMAKRYRRPAVRGRQGNKAISHLRSLTLAFSSISSEDADGSSYSRPVAWPSAHKNLRGRAICALPAAPSFGLPWPAPSERDRASVVDQARPALLVPSPVWQDVRRPARRLGVAGRGYHRPSCAGYPMIDSPRTMNPRGLPPGPGVFLNIEQEAAAMSKDHSRRAQHRPMAQESELRGR
jgi:hypothetical protein